MMKKIVALMLAVLMCIMSAPSAMASERKINIEQVAVQLINDALSKPEVFDLPNLTGETLYVCEAVHPHTLSDSGLVSSDNIEYYLVRTDDEIIACITLCYVEGQVASACLNIGLAKMINAVCEVDKAFQLVVQDGSLYIKTEEGVIRGTEDHQSRINTLEEDTILTSIDSAKVT